MKYIKSEKYNTPELQKKIMGPNPIKLEEELLLNNKIPEGATVCDLGSGQGLTSVFLAKEYGFTVYAADLWSDPEENRKFFDSLGVARDKLIPVKADAQALPFEKEFFDAVVSTDSYNYFGRDERYLDDKLLPFVKPGGYIYIATVAGGTCDGSVAGMGFLALAIMIFGNWKPLGIALGSLMFGLLKCIGPTYSFLDINGDGVFLLKELNLPMYFYNLIPYVTVLIVLAFTSKKSRAPKAEGIPYDKGAR